jgi:hypothetical protein
MSGSLPHGASQVTREEDRHTLGAYGLPVYRSQVVDRGRAARLRRRSSRTALSQATLGTGLISARFQIDCAAWQRGRSDSSACDQSWQRKPCKPICRQHQYEPDCEPTARTRVMCTSSTAPGTAARALPTAGQEAASGGRRPVPRCAAGSCAPGAGWRERVERWP